MIWNPKIVLPAITIPLMLLYWICGMACGKRLKWDNIIQFGLYSSCIPAGYYVVLAAMRCSEIVDPLYVEIFGVGLSLISLQKVSLIIWAMLKQKTPAKATKNGP